jgi:hypothetical protein
MFNVDIGQVIFKKNSLRERGGRLRLRKRETERETEREGGGEAKRH